MGKASLFLRKMARQVGYQIARFGQTPIGIDPVRDIGRFLRGVPRPVMLDVGANTGQTIARFRRRFPQAVVHAFEPSPTTFATLRAGHEGVPGVHLWNVGVGSAAATMTLLENDHPTMTSFLAPGAAAWGTIVRTTEVPVVTLDGFAAEHRLDFVHVLKSDTQGFDLEVFKGASQLLAENRVALVFFEFTFSAMYRNLPSFPEVFQLLADSNYALAAYYEPHVQDDLVGWTDFLFVSRQFYRAMRERGPGGRTIR